jgi:hypothetical protein
MREDDMKRKFDPDLLMIAAVAIVIVYHAREVYHIMRDPEIRNLFAGKIAGLFREHKPRTFVHVEPVGSTWMKDNGL